MGGRVLNIQLYQCSANIPLIKQPATMKLLHQGTSRFALDVH